MTEIRIDIPGPPAEEPYGTCDMGLCDGPAAAWVWSQEMGCWLASCAGCDPSKPRPAPPSAPPGYRCSCGHWFDDIPQAEGR